MSDSGHWEKPVQIFGISFRASLLAILAFCTAAYVQTSAAQTTVTQAEGAVPAHTCSREDIEYHPRSFTSGGKAIRVDHFQPKLPGRYPVIIMIHGSGGLLTHTGTEMPGKENFGEMQIAC